MVPMTRFRYSQKGALSILHSPSLITMPAGWLLAAGLEKVGPAERDGTSRPGLRLNGFAFTRLGQSQFMLWDVPSSGLERGVWPF